MKCLANYRFNRDGRLAGWPDIKSSGSPSHSWHPLKGGCLIILSFLNGARKNIDFELTRMIENVKRPKTMEFERTGMIESALKRPKRIDFERTGMI